MKNPICFLVDDDEDDRDIFMIALENADDSYKCVAAKNGVDALNIIDSDNNFNPEFIFIDLNMPYMSGKECLQAIKNNSRFTNTPIVMYTTSSYNKDIDETKQLGASHFLVKPPGINSLTKLLRDILIRKDLPYLLEVEN
jgi:CheY-like chemotaxis protein